MTYCLPKFASDAFKEKLKSGEIKPEKLSEMTSEERRTFFSDFLGEANAKQTNALFESKLLLKNQQQGIINWAKTVTGIKPEVLKDILAKVDRMTEVLQPKELDNFLSDLAERKLGFGVSVEEAGKITDLAKKVSEAKNNIESGGDRLAFGRAKVEFSNYVSDLKNGAKKSSLGDKIKEIPGITKSLKASLDDSALFRQGWKTLWTNPTIWAKNAAATFKDAYDTFGGKAVMDEINADIVSRPNYDLMKKAKLAIGNVEEAFPTSLPEKVPILGKAFKASENAYTGFLYKTRADVFDKYIDIARRTGVDVTDKTQLESIGRLVNSLTGRGNLGPLEPVANTVNNIFFSPRSIKSTIDTLTAHTFDKGVTPFVRKQAAINLLKIISGTAAIMVTANAVKPGSVEFDPRSTDFGKIKIGDTRFEITGGMGSVVTLASRLITHSSKSSTTGKVNKIDSGKYGAQTSTDVFVNFLTNKLSPVASVIKDLQTGTDFSGNKSTPLNEAKNLFAPLPVTNYLDTRKNPNAADNLLTVIADALGISTNTYSKKK